MGQDTYVNTATPVTMSPTHITVLVIVCYNPSCTTQDFSNVFCGDCNRSCCNSLCFSRHKEPRERPRAKMHVSDCDLIKRCPTCKRFYRVAMTKEKTLHMCEGLKCTICGEKLPPGSTVTLGGHQCYIQPCTGDDQLDEKLIFYDF